MFANPLWSLLLLALPVALYFFVIRPRLKVNFTDLYADIDTLWGRVWARIYAFRTLVIAALGAVLTAIPDLLVKIAPLDFSWLPQPWAAYVSPVALFAVAVMKAFETTPGQAPPPPGS